MPAGVARKEDHLAAGQFTGQEAVGRLAKRRGHLHPLLVGETFKVIQSAAADDADAGSWHKDQDFRGGLSARGANWVSTTRVRACLETTRGAAARDFGCGQGGLGGAQRPAAGCKERANAGHGQKTRRPEGFRGKGRLASVLLSRRSTTDILL